jgi:hypothetical protein
MYEKEAFNNHIDTIMNNFYYVGPVWDTSTSKPTGYGVKFLTDYLLNLKK